MHDLAPLILGVRWDSPEHFLIEHAPTRAAKESYTDFQRRIEAWSAPVLAELMSQIDGIPIDFDGHNKNYDDLLDLLWEYFDAIADFVARWRFTRFPTPEHPFGQMIRADACVSPNGSIDAALASKLLAECARSGTIPSPALIAWLCQGFSEYERGVGEKTLDECLGLQLPGKGAAKPIKERRIEERNFQYARHMSLLTSHGATIDAAAELVAAADELRRQKVPTALQFGPISLSADTIAEKWRKDWKKRWPRLFKQFTDHPALLVHDPAVGFYDESFSYWPEIALNAARKSGLKI